MPGPITATSLSTFLVDENVGYVAVDEGDYNALPKAMLDRVIEAVPSKLSDEF